jgi:hypothetical protein
MALQLRRHRVAASSWAATPPDGTAKVSGDPSVLMKLASAMVEFDPRFEIMPGTRAKGTQLAKVDPYEAIPQKAIAE